MSSNDHRALASPFRLFSLNSTWTRGWSKHVTIVAVLIAYTVFRVIVAAIPSAAQTGWRSGYLLDVGLISLLLPRDRLAQLLLYAFVLLSATVRWGWRGAAWTTALLLGLGAVGLLTRNSALSHATIESLAPDVLVDRLSARDRQHVHLRGLREQASAPGRARYGPLLVDAGGIRRLPLAAA